MDNTYNTNIDELLLKNRNLLAGSVTEAKNTANAISDSQTKVVNDSYNKAVADTNKSYTSEYQKNAVQKLINEQNVAEKMANLGLTGSGLNRTQQTAVQMGYSNNKAAIDRNKQSALDTLAQNLSASIAQIEQQRAASLLDINNTFEQQVMTNTMNEYNTNMNANLANEQMKQNRINSSYSTNSIIDNNTNGGYQVDTAYFKGDLNPDAYTYGTFSNKYQPKGIDGHGKIKNSGEKLELETQTLSGQKQTLIQNVWLAEDGTKWYWEGRKNKYIQIKE